MGIFSWLMRALPNPIPLSLSLPVPVVDHDSWIDESKPQQPLKNKYPSVRLNNTVISLGQHFTVVGATGSGKTRFAVALMEFLRRQYPYAKRYVLDSTADGMEGIYAPLIVEGDTVPDLLAKPDYTQVWTPDTDEIGAYSEWLRRINAAREPAIVLLDETASLLIGRSGAPMIAHMNLLKQGRKHGITVINLTQEIAKMPPTIFRQMSHYIQFRIGNDQYDQSQARRYLDIAKDDQRHPSAPYGFFYKQVRVGSAVQEYRDWQEFFGSSLRGGKNF